MIRDTGLSHGAVTAASDIERGKGIDPGQEATPIRLLAFAGASNWPVWIGQRKGFFAGEALAVTLDITPNSRRMALDVFSGQFDIALTAIDNVVAYVEGQGEAELPGPADFTAFMGIDDGMLALMAVPGIHSIDDLRGKDLAVDALTTGFAFVLREALAKSGVTQDEVHVVAVGGGAQRLDALRDRRQAATLLNAPLDLISEDSGSVRLADMHALIGPYQGVCAMARRVWLGDHRETALSFVRAFQASVAWLVAPGNKDEAVAILRECVPGTSPELAQTIYDRLTDPERGIRRDGAIDIEGLLTVMRLRSTYAAAARALGSPMKYIDSELLGEAFASRSETSA